MKADILPFLLLTVFSVLPIDAAEVDSRETYVDSLVSKPFEKIKSFRNKYYNPCLEEEIEKMFSLREDTIKNGFGCSRLSSTLEFLLNMIRGATFFVEAPDCSTTEENFVNSLNSILNEAEMCMISSCSYPSNLEEIADIQTNCRDSVMQRKIIDRASDCFSVSNHTSEIANIIIEPLNLGISWKEISIVSDKATDGFAICEETMRKNFTDQFETTSLCSTYRFAENLREMEDCRKKFVEELKESLETMKNKFLHPGN